MDSIFRFFELFVEFLGWLKIVASPLLLGILVGIMFYSISDNGKGEIAFGICSFLGLVIGVIWATRVWRNEGTNQFLSKTIATPELDKLKEEETKK